MSDNTSIISRPITGGTNFNAVGNPIVYKLRRQDSGFDSINNVGGFAQLQSAGPDFTSYFEVGDVIYLQLFDTTATITASEYSAGNLLLTLDLPFTISGAGYINNLSKRTDYRIEVEVFDFDTELSMGPRITAAPAIDGSVSINISGIVSAYLSANWNMTVLVAFEDGTSKVVFIKFEEFYDGEYFGVETDIANPIGCVFAMINILQGSPPDFTRYQYGGNMLPFAIGHSQKKWITRFQSPSMWRGWPFTISFLNIGFANPNRVVVFYNSAGEVIISDTTPLLLDGDGVYRISLGAIEDLAAEAKIFLQSPGGDELTQQLTVKIKDPCPAQVLLFWKNSLGGDSWWMFEESQEYRYTYPSGRKVTRMRLYSDNLILNEWDAINELNSPTDVIAANLTDYGMDNSIDKTHFRNDNQVFIVNADGEKVGVIVIETENLTKTMYKKHAVEITIELPEIFTV